MMKAVAIKVAVLFSIYELSVSQDDSHYHALQEGDHLKKPIIPILKNSYQRSHHGYEFSYETGNGIHAEEAGYIKNKGDKKHETLVQQGKVTYHDEHGQPITITYIADEHGFQVQGDHLPTPPPIPKEILEALAENQHQIHEEEESQDQVQQVGYGEQEHY